MNTAQQLRMRNFTWTVAILWILGGIKAYGGQWYKLPIIGEFAWKSVNQ